MPLIIHRHNNQPQVCAKLSVTCSTTSTMENTSCDDEDHPSQLQPLKPNDDTAWEEHWETPALREVAGNQGIFDAYNPAAVRAHMVSVARRIQEQKLAELRRYENFRDNCSTRVLLSTAGCIVSWWLIVYLFMFVVPPIVTAVCILILVGLFATKKESPQQAELRVAGATLMTKFRLTMILSDNRQQQRRSNHTIQDHNQAIMGNMDIEAGNRKCS